MLVDQLSTKNLTLRILKPISPSRACTRKASTFRRKSTSTSSRPIRHVVVSASQSSDLLSEAERFVQTLVDDNTRPTPTQVSSDLMQQYEALVQKAQILQQQIDALYTKTFEDVSPASVTVPQQTTTQGITDINFKIMTETTFGELGRSNPSLLQAIITAKKKENIASWLSFQSEIAALKLQRSRAEREANDILSAAETVSKRERNAAVPSEYDAASQKWDEDSSPSSSSSTTMKTKSQGVKIVLVTGFESFNVELYRQAAVQVSKQFPNISLRVFSDRDICPKREEIEAELSSADVFFGSLLFDFDQVEWLKERVDKVPVRFVFESALELMSSTQVGSFQMNNNNNNNDGNGSGSTTSKPTGPPPAVKKVLAMFGSGREEDKMVGYLSFLKVGPKLLKFLPNWAPQKIKDLRTWLTVYAYWNQGGQQNVVSMLQYMVTQLYPAALDTSTTSRAGTALFGGITTSTTSTTSEPPPPVETPATGCLHPQAINHTANGMFTSPIEYMKWYRQHGPVQDPAAPTVAVLLYRKHVITEQPYIADLIECLEAEGLIPLPIFINGVEAHTIVRDVLTSVHEQQLVKTQSSSSSSGVSTTLKSDAVMVDAVVNTIGFPLVGGPAGTMEGGRQAEVAKAILSTKNIPYIVAAPLLIQDLRSWVEDGVAGLQSVVLYSLPELDGAIDTVPLGGLVGDNIHLIPERVKRLSGRLKKWINLRRKPAHEKKLAVLLYGFPPGVGATGTAALLNVPKSLEHLLRTLAAEGYDLGTDVDLDALDGEALIAALVAQEDQRALSQGAVGIKAAAAAAGAGEGGANVTITAADITPAALKQYLTFPQGYGPTEWGPIPFLPDSRILVQRLEKQWGELGKYRGICTSNTGDAVVSGLQLGNVFIGVQPLLGVEGDPMRMLFERDLTPHPQYAAFYQWLQKDYNADAVLHFGMHGTVEWLPGAPLGNSGFSWSDILLGDLPNVYIYAANNPSESIVAKRRGYGTIVSHNVPPYGRAGLYKQLSELKSVLQEYREDPEVNQALQESIVQLLNAAGLQEDCPYSSSSSSNNKEEEKKKKILSGEEAVAIPPSEFKEYASRVYVYLQEVENRVFSEGLHVLGQPPAIDQTFKYLSAYFGDDLSTEAVQAVAEAPSLLPSASSMQSPSMSTTGGSGADIEAARLALERTFASTTPLDPLKLEEALRIKHLLQQNTQELTSVVRALNGEYILPEAGGDLLRDGAGVLPTGRNIYALDPYRMPGPSALTRGAAAAEAILIQHRAANDGAWPETVAVNLWGLDAIKTKGESVAMALHFVGARPVKEGTGRIARFELIPLSELGRPRIDVLCNMSGIFRDSFQNVVELLDDMFQKAATAANEPTDLNFVKKHAQNMSKKGLANSGARLFSNPAGDYGSMVNERVGAGNWEDGDELGATWVSRNAFSYGRGGERGTARPEVLQSLLSTTDRIVQEVDSVEYGLTDIQEYYANTGALRRAAEMAGTDENNETGNVNGEKKLRKVGCSIVEAFEKEVKPRELEEVLRLEYRSKLLNPKWAQAMAAQGSGGVFEISQRLTGMVGWGATSRFSEDWTWNQAAETYVLDEEMANTLRKANPQAFRNVMKRMLEAAGRGMWNADDQLIQKLQGLYGELDDQLEGV
jgi:magnesium chelatase subunit H